MTLRLDPSADAALDRDLHKVLDHLAHDIAADARRLVPVRSSDLKDSIEPEVDGLTARVSTDIPYWRFVEYSTPEHEIRPNAKKALFWEGAAHPVGRVKHPGTKAQPFLRPALLKRRPLR